MNIRSLVVTALLFFSMKSFSQTASEAGILESHERSLESTNKDIYNQKEVRLRAHFEFGVKAPADITLWYKGKLLADLSLYGSPLQKEIDWIVVNPFRSEEEFHSEKEYLIIKNQFGHIIPVLDFEILPDSILP